MRFPSGVSFAHKMALMAVLASAMAAAVLIASFLAPDLVSAHSQLQGRLSTLADIVGQNSTAALNFDDRDAAMEVLAALLAEALWS